MSFKNQFKDYTWAFMLNFNQEVGYGHLKRVETLALELKKQRAKSIFLYRDLNLKKHLTFETIYIESLADLKKIADLKTILIIDDHGVDLSYKEAFSHFLLVVGIDELGDLRGSFDIHFITTLLGIEPKEGFFKNSYEYIGIKWFVLKEPSYEKIDASYNDKVMITFGGSDPLHLTEKLLLLIKQENLDYQHFIVFLGPLFDQKRIDLLRENYPLIEFKSNVNNLEAYFKVSKFVIASGGITAYESLNAGAIPLLIPQHLEQKSVILNLKKKGLAFYLGDYANININKLKRFLACESLLELKTELFKKFSDLGANKGRQSLLKQVLYHANNKYRRISSRSN